MGRGLRKGGIHPLFLLLGIYYSFTGELFYFLVLTISSIEHELAHAYAAQRRGYRLRKIVLMPYGAAIQGDTEGMSVKDEFYIAIAGPICSLFTGLFFLALWWLYPAVYPYTELAFYSSMSLFLVNLIPAYPLDGGRVLYCLLKWCKVKRGMLYLRLVSATFTIFLFAYFLARLVSGKCMLSLLLFSVFLALGLISGESYERRAIYLEANFSRGVEVKWIAVDKRNTLSSLLRFLEEGKYIVGKVFDGEEEIGTFTQKQFGEWVLSSPLQSTIEENLHK
jgi:stage IV sporulation protein FB